MGKALHTQNMIEDGDHVVVGVSGGKDSLSLLWLLRERIRRIPIEYKVTAVHVDPGFGADSAGQMEIFFQPNRPFISAYIPYSPHPGLFSDILN